jgi:hypothetical protein
MMDIKRITQVVSLLTVVLVVAAMNDCKKVNPQISVKKLPDQTGGMYQISGSGFDGNESVKLEIQNAPLKQPDSWQLGTAAAANGSFSFNSEDFRCASIQDQNQRNQLGGQQVTFVAQGVNSHWSTSATSTAFDILICP